MWYAFNFSIIFSAFYNPFSFVWNFESILIPWVIRTITFFHYKRNRSQIQGKHIANLIKEVKLIKNIKITEKLSRSFQLLRIIRWNINLRNTEEYTAWSVLTKAIKLKILVQIINVTKNYLCLYKFHECRMKPHFLLLNNHVVLTLVSNCDSIEVNHFSNLTNHPIDMMSKTFDILTASDDRKVKCISI